ncbi:hypothetical protein GCM10023405_32110 [Streptomonospora salina]
MPVLTAAGAITAACAGFNDWPSPFQVAMVASSAAFAAAAVVFSDPRTPLNRKKRPARVGTNRTAEFPLAKHAYETGRLADGQWRILAAIHDLGKVGVWST